MFIGIVTFQDQVTVNFHLVSQYSHEIDLRTFKANLYEFWLSLPYDGMNKWEAAKPKQANTDIKRSTRESKMMIGKRLKDFGTNYDIFLVTCIVM